MQDPVRMLVWADAAQAPMVRALLRHPELKVTAAGTPDANDGPRLASDLGVSCARDLRAAVEQGRTFDLILLLTGATLSREERSAIAKSSAIIVSLEPRPVRFADLRDTPQDALLCRTLPAWSDLLRDPGLTEMRRQFGPIDAAQIHRAAPLHLGSPRALLVDALDLLFHLMGEPETIEAAGEPDVTPISGTCTAHLRTASGASATLFIRAGASEDRLDAFCCGAAGTMSLTRSAWTWHAPDGVTLDEGRFPDSALPAVDRLAIELVDLARNRSVTRPDDDRAHRVLLLSAAEAARISSVTRHTEQIPKLAALAGA